MIFQLQCVTDDVRVASNPRGLGLACKLLGLAWLVLINSPECQRKNVKSIRLMPCVVRCFQYGPLKGHQTISVISRLIIQIRPSWNKIIASDWGIQGQSAQAFVQWWSLCMQPIFSSTMNLEFDSKFHAENWEGWFSGPLLHHFGPMFVLCLQVSFSLTWLIQGLIKTQSLVIDDNSYSITSQNGPGRGYYPYAPCKTMVPFGVAEWERVHWPGGWLSCSIGYLSPYYP